jgi:hypothetical protein
MDLREAAAALSTERLEAEITTQAGHLAAAECRWLALIAEHDRREAWKQWECRSGAHWLSWHASLDVRSAREKLRVAHALEELTTIRDEFAAGRLSYSKVRALTRIATVGTERDLIEIARHSTAAQVEQLVRGYRRADSAAALSAANERHDRRSVSWSWGEDGSLVGRFTLDPETGAALIQALEAAVEDGSAEPSSIGARRADALARLAESFLANGAAQRSDGDRHLVEIQVDAATLADDSGSVCGVVGGPALAAETARRLSCDASLVAVAFDSDGNPLDVSRRTRTIPAALRRAVKARDKRCRFLGCDGPIREIHHLVHFAHGGATCLANLAGLCGFHHRAVHEGRLTLEFAADGELRVLRADGTVIEAPDHPIDPQDGGIEARNRAHDVEIAARTIASQWYGDPFDVGWAVSALLHERDRVERSAERSEGDYATP